MDFNFSRKDSEEFLAKNFNGLNINGLEGYDYDFTEPEHKLYERLKNKAIFSSEMRNSRIVLEFFDNSPSDFTFICMKIYNRRFLTAFSVVEYNPCEKKLTVTDYDSALDLISFIFDNDGELFMETRAKRAMLEEYGKRKAKEQCSEEKIKKLKEEIARLKQEMHVSE